MPLSTQQLADVEALLLVWYTTIRELKAKRKAAEPGSPEGLRLGFDFVDVQHQPSGDQIRYWVETYGFASTERGLHQGLRSFLKKVNGIVKTDKDAIWMANYLNATIKNIHGSFEPARQLGQEDHRRAS